MVEHKQEEEKVHIHQRFLDKETMVASVMVVMDLAMPVVAEAVIMVEPVVQEILLIPQVVVVHHLYPATTVVLPLKKSQHQLT